MRLPFTKMHGCGNDYIFIECADGAIASPGELSIIISDRHKGIGGDGTVLVLPSDTADARMRIFNSDGSEGMMCGNAIRCVAKLLYENGSVHKRRMKIETASGIREIALNVSLGDVVSARVDMGPAELSPGKIPVALPGDSVIDRRVTIGGAEYGITCVSMGNPHAVVFTRDVDAIDIGAVGPAFEYSPVFPDRVNVEFAEPAGPGRLKARVWERGSGATQACGTGAAAVAVAAVLNGVCSRDEEILVRLPGGELKILCAGGTVYMTGDCVKVFEGIINI